MNRHSDRVQAIPPTPPSAAALAEPFLAMPGLIGAELAHPLSEIGRLLELLRSGGAPSGLQLTAVDLALAQAQRISRQSQQFSRLAGNRLRQSHEKLKLHVVLASILAHRLAAFRAQGVVLRTHLQPIEVIVDPGLLVGLLEAAVAWAVDQGRQLNVSLALNNWPEHARLVLKASAPVVVADDQERPGSPDSLTWRVLVQTASSMGVGVSRVLAADHSLVSLEFPRTVQRLEGLTAIEVDGGRSAGTGFAESKPLAGHRVLVVTPDQRLQLEVKELCGRMGLVLDRSGSVAEAVRFCEQEIPHLIVIEEELVDAQFTELRGDLLRSEGHCQVIEIVRAADVIEIGSWAEDSVSRVSRDALATQLTNLMVLELAKVA